MAQINWFPSQHNYICRLQIVLTVKRLITLGINKAEEFHSFQSVSRQVKLWCKARHSFFWLQHKLSSVHMHSPTWSFASMTRVYLSFLEILSKYVEILFLFSYSHCSFDQPKMSNHSLTARGTNLPFSHKSVISIAHEQNIICSKTLKQNTYLLAVICWSRGGLSANEKEGKIHRMINIINP